MKLILTIFFVSFTTILFSQNNKAVSILGVVLDAENRVPIPSVNVVLKGTLFGTSTDLNGHFTIIMQRTDTLVFSSIGYEKSYFTFDATLEKDGYTLVQLLVKNTLQLQEVIVFPWPEWEVFERAFLKNTPTTLPLNRALEVKKTLAEVSEIEYQTNKFMYDQMRYQKLYDLNGIVPPNNFLNPVNWTNFIYELQKSNSNK